MMSGTLKYDTRTIWFHWLTAALIVVMWSLPKLIQPLFPRPERYIPISTHIVIGIVLVCVYVARVIWRLGAGRKLPAAETGALGSAGRTVHYLLYALVAVTLCLGLTYEAVRADFIFKLVQLPSIAPGNDALRRMIAGWHETAANSIMVLAGLHGVAALYHHFVRRDGVLRRML